MTEKEISVRIRRTAYDTLMKRGEKSIKDAIDKLLNCTKSHVVQTAIGRVSTGNNGLTRKQISDDYVAMICTLDKNGRYVDIALTREQLEDLREIIRIELELMDKFGNLQGIKPL
ncbi:MAG: hypothetical protein KAS66_00060 [Candidatus Omnitrophica bacterium]|nr:hypothetical protein [Candidatus Omnitrophota bacterium]